MSGATVSAVRRLFAYPGALLCMGWACVRAARQVSRREVFEQAYEVAGRSVFFVSLTMAFTGAILVMQAAGQASRVLGDTSPIGGAFLQLLVSEFGPLVSALLVAARYGAGVAASLGAMRVTEQIDALRLCGAEPVPFLVAPRFFGAILGILPVVVVATAVSWSAGAWVAVAGYQIGLGAFANMQQTHLADLGMGLCKALAFGALIPLVAAHAGLQARSGAQAVGEATTSAVIGASVTLLVVDFALSLLFYGLRAW